MNIANLSVTRTNSIDRDESWRIADGKTRDRDDKLSAFGYFIGSIRSQYATVDLLSKNIICLTSLNPVFESRMPKMYEAETFKPRIYLDIISLMTSRQRSRDILVHFIYRDASDNCRAIRRRLLVSNEFRGSTRNIHRDLRSDFDDMFFFLLIRR